MSKETIYIPGGGLSDMVLMPWKVFLLSVCRYTCMPGCSGLASHQDNQGGT